MTIKDLSALTGYSVGTVSRVLNNQPNVSEKARSVILEAVRTTGFQLNANAKQLKQQHSNSILVLVKGRSNQLFGALVEALQPRIAETGHPLSVDYLDENYVPAPHEQPASAPPHSGFSNFEQSETDWDAACDQIMLRQMYHK